MSIEDIRQRKLQEMQQRAQQQGEEEELQQHVEMQKQGLLKKLLTPDAKARLTRIKLADPALAEQVESLVFYIYQTKGPIQIDDATLRELLVKISGKKKEIKITRK